MYPFDGHFLTRPTFGQRLIGATATCNQPSEIGGPEPEKPKSMFDDGVQGVRMNHYPPCVQANKVMGLTPHSDATGLTLLIQANDVRGLQIKKNGKWISIRSIHYHLSTSLK